MTDWNRFLFLESTANLKPLVKRLSGRRPSTEILLEITACLQQGRLFFQSAEVSAIEIRPLLLFYGTVAYAKALIASVNCSSIATFRHSHGIKDVTSHDASLAKLLVRFEKDGTFMRFNDVVSQFNCLFLLQDAHEYKSIPMPTAKGRALEGLQISLQDILARIPSLADLYSATFNEDALGQRIFLFHGNTGLWELHIDQAGRSPTRADLIAGVSALRERFPLVKNWRLTEAQRAYGKTHLIFANVSVPADEFREDVLGEYTERFIIRDGLPTTGATIETILNPVSSFRANDYPALVSPIRGHYIPEPSLHYIGMFLLSSLVRYRPHTWVHALTRSATQSRPADDRALALVQAFMDAHANFMPDYVAHLLNPSE